MTAEDDVQEQTRELALLAGETFARLRLEPEGYRAVAYERRPMAGFDHVYAQGDNVVLIDTLAADEQLDSIGDAEGDVIEAGTRRYVELVTENMRRRAGEVASQIETALRAGKLRYFEVRQPIDSAGELGDIEIRQFAL